MRQALLALTIAFGVTLVANAADAPKLEGIKCPVSQKPVAADHHVDHKEGHVYFCCPNCPKAFKANTEKFAAKANQQLFATGQFKQVACPFSGQPVKEHAEGNNAPGFCCENCLGKYNKADEAAQLEMVFADKPFAKGFEAKEAE
ncbi:MAG: hypothetical protein KDA80_14330 [Planctomycetaceae bacterium]|nr:hypothetical protein [Planctomycetaceae bacterium]